MGEAFKRARQRHITLFVSSGDQGSTNIADEVGDVFPVQNVSYPASWPQVTGVGGTNLFFGEDGHTDPNGEYLDDEVWNDEAQSIAAAGGSGVSALFGRPRYQDELPSSVRRSLRRHRGVPDVAYNGGVVVHLGFAGMNGFFIFGGTSAGAAQWAGVVADTNQALGRPMGFINNRLYKLGHTGLPEREEHEQGERCDWAGLFHNITVGDNGFCGFAAPSGDPICVPGFSATPDWDLATGWGTPHDGLIPALIAVGDDDDDDNDF